MLLLYQALQDVRPEEIISALAATDWRYMMLALLSVGVNLLAKAARWQVLLRRSGRPVPFSAILISLLTGQTLNWFLPGRVGDLTRVYAIGRYGPGRSYVLGTIGLEKVIDTCAYALLFLLALGMLPLPDWLSGSGYTLVAATIVMILGVTGLAARPGAFIRLAERSSAWVPPKWRERGLTWLRLGLSSLEILHGRMEVVLLVVWSLVAWATAILNNHIVGLAMGLRLPWTAALLVLVVLQAGISLPGVPGRVGMFQYLCILSLATFGVTEAAAFSYGIILQALVLLPTTLVSLPFFAWLGPIKALSDPGSLSLDASLQNRGAGKD